VVSTVRGARRPEALGGAPETAIPRDRDATVRGQRHAPALTSGSGRAATASTCEPWTVSFAGRRSTAPHVRHGQAGR
jgi:hypothetical protein